MQPLIVFKIPIEERIFVVPFDFQGDNAGGKSLDVIDLMGNRLSGDTIDGPLNLEFMFAPPLLVKRSTEPLRSLCFASARSDDLLDRYCRTQQNAFQLLRDFWKIDAENRLGVGMKFDLKAGGEKQIKHIES